MPEEPRPVPLKATQPLPVVRHVLHNDGTVEDLDSGLKHTSLSSQPPPLVSAGGRAAQQHNTRYGNVFMLLGTIKTWCIPSGSLSSTNTNQQLKQNC